MPQERLHSGTEQRGMTGLDEDAVTLDSVGGDSDKEEGEWSGEESAGTQEASTHLFQAEHFQRLLQKVITTLNYKVETQERPRSTASAELDARVFKRPPQAPAVSLFPDTFEDIIRAEWASPGSGSSLLSIAKRFYVLPEGTMEDLKVPLVDAPMVVLHSGAVLPRDGENALKDPMDKKNETTLKKAHEATSLAIRASAVLSNFTRAIILWADDLVNNTEASPLERKRALLKIKRAAEFASDASQDTLQFATRAQAANVIIRRNIWLKHWRVDTLSKSNLSTEKYAGRLLFRESNLDKVLVETKEKKKAMPLATSGRDKSYRSRPDSPFVPTGQQEEEGLQRCPDLQILSKKRAATGRTL